MADGGKVRVVRCPKCEKLLPEPPNTPVYRCGGCNATLLAKNQLYVRSDVSSEKSDEEKVRVSENSEKFSEKRGIGSNEMSETDQESDGVEFRRKDRVLPERTADAHSSSSSISENKEFLNDSNGIGGLESKPSSYDRGRYRRPSKAPMENWAIRGDLGLNSDGLMAKYAEENVVPKAQIEDTTGFRRFRQIEDTTGVPWRMPRAVAEGVRFSPYSDEGASNYHLDSAYRYGDQIKNQSHLDGSDKVKSLEQDRAEILRQLDELRDRLTRSSDASDQPKERFLPSNRRIVPPNPYNGSDTWSMEGSSQASRGNHIRRLPRFNHDPVPLMNQSDLHVQKFYSQMHAPNEILGYGQPLGPRMPRRDFHQAYHYPHRPVNDYLAGQYMDIGPDPTIPYPQNAFYDEPPCSCLHCYNRQWPVAAQVPPAILRNQRLPNAANSDMLYHLDGHGPPGLGDYDLRGANAQLCSREPQPGARMPINLESDMGGFRRPHLDGHGRPGLGDYNLRGANACLYSREPQPHARMPSDLVSGMGGFKRPHPQRTVITEGKERSCQPLAGGAPFVTCCNCFELLQLPKKLLSIDKNQGKLRCGTCSKVISYNLEGKRLIFSMPSPTQTLPVDNNKPSLTQRLEVEANTFSRDMMKEGLSSDGKNAERMIDCSSDNSSNIIQSSGTKAVLSPPFSLVGDGATGMDRLLKLGKSEKMQELSSSSSSSEHEESPDSMVTPRDVPNSAELPLKVEKASSVPGSPLREPFEYSPTNPLVSRSGKGSRSQRSDKEKIFPKKAISRQSTVKDASAATETDCSFNEFTNSGISQDSEEVSKEEVRPWFSKGGESFFAGLIKKSFRDFGRPNQALESGKPCVSVNGQPIPDHLVKKAEKQAGPIQPGQYWVQKVKHGFGMRVPRSMQ
ncbi:uncharacterized protein LOC131245061 isoform X2 [Magnolia sinica]|uniref:uncharacterized protein LOC131245061 isoform X2 n=1 Tax=Magnolia sinica TaxID=86752 RepID=UPI00265835E8|nr:uncharacterized protein LOC131245061 isoform X2 [Magnolia sinica]